MDDTTSPPKFRTKYKYGKKKRTQHLAKILKQRKVEESSDSDSTIITIPNVPSGTSSIATTSRTQTKLRVMDSALPKVCHPEKDTQWCLVDLGQLNGLLCHIKCPSCETATLSFSRGEGRYGFCYTISLSCSTCHVEAANTYSSRRSSVKKSSQPFIVNDLIVLFFNQLGLGHTAMKKLSSLFGWEGLHLKTFQDKEKHIISKIIDNTNDVLSASVTKVKEAYSALDPLVSTDPLCITVSFDGSWHKRGHASMYGFASVIDVLTGLVVDYVVLSKYCHACSIKKTEFGDHSNQFTEWYQGHKEQCSINYTGSSNAMEVEAACRLWQRSEDQHDLRYTGFLSDGDSKAHKAVCDLDIYPEPILKEECINHVHKRMGTALINLGKQKKLGGKGFGRLTKEKAIKFQHYYRWAIVNNIGNQDAMRDAIWASLFHCVSTDESPQHGRCPAGPNSWCFYQKSIATNTDIPPHSGCLMPTLSREWKREKHKIQMNVYTVLFGQGVRKQFLLVNISYMEQPHQLLLSSMKVPFSYLKLWNV